MLVDLRPQGDNSDMAFARGGALLGDGELRLLLICEQGGDVEPGSAAIGSENTNRTKRRLSTRAEARTWPPGSGAVSLRSEISILGTPVCQGANRNPSPLTSPTREGGAAAWGPLPYSPQTRKERHGSQCCLRTAKSPSIPGIGVIPTATTQIRRLERDHLTPQFPHRNLVYRARRLLLWIQRRSRRRVSCGRSHMHSGRT